MTAARIGVVLAGGRATRMDGDKAGATLGGRPLLAWALETVAVAGLSPRVCARAATRLPTIEGLDNDAIWREPVPSASEAAISTHPLAGVAHAVRQAGEPIVALPVDLPLLPAAVLSALAARPEPLAVIGVGGRPAGLVAKVGPEQMEALAAAAAEGAPALRTLLALGAVVVELDALAPGTDTERALTNVNSPEDLQAIARLQ